MDWDEEVAEGFCDITIDVDFQRSGVSIFRITTVRTFSTLYSNQKVGGYDRMPNRDEIPHNRRSIEHWVEYFVEL
jgi:hypothetical protein